MAEIEIFLIITIDETERQISFLSIPNSDIERLAVLPFRWIRYVLFAVCGAEGDLSATPNGPAVDYDQTEIPNDGNIYYYRPSGDCAYVDYEGFNDRITTTDGTVRRINFRRDVIRRDRVCVVTEFAADDCDAAHLIPHSKGDEYIQRVSQLRSSEDHPRIDMTENGILVSKILHGKLARGEVAFIKTPNYGLGPEDIKRFRRGDERTQYITLQWIKKPQDLQPGWAPYPLWVQASRNAGMDIPPSVAHQALENVDALFGGEGSPLPSTVILDYVYGIAAYTAWSSKHDDGFNQMKAYRDENYADILTPSSGGVDDTDDSYTDVTSGPDDPTDSDSKPPQTGKRYTSTRRSGIEEGMDKLNMFLMYINGMTPEMAAERREKEIEREEWAAQEAGRIKVMEWNHNTEMYS